MRASTTHMRRSLLLLASVALCGAVLVAGCGGGDGGGSSGSGSAASGGSTTKQLKVAFVTAGSIATASWDKGGFAAFQGLVKTLGAKESHLEMVSYDSAAQVLTRLARAGNNVIIAHSSGYEPAVLQVAAQFPKTWFLIYSGLSTTNGLKNVAGWKTNWSEHGFMQGAIACLLSKTGKVGFVSSAPIPAFTTMTAGFKQATEQVGRCKSTPGSFLNAWTGSFTDVAKAKQAAGALIAKGADVMADGADAAGAGAMAAVKERHLLYVGGIGDQYPVAPQIVVASVVANFPQAYDEMAQLIKSGKLEAKVYQSNLENGGLTLATPFHNVAHPAQVEAEAQKVVDEIKSGAIKVDDTAEIKP
jgi:basic membrane protein A